MLRCHPCTETVGTEEVGQTDSRALCHLMGTLHKPGPRYLCTAHAHCVPRKAHETTAHAHIAR